VTVGGQPQTTTMNYTGRSGSGAGNFLTLVSGPIAGANTYYTYDSAERVYTVTDSEGYTVTTAYDNLDRPKSTIYPDGTSDQTFYNKLDVDHTIDRQGRVTKNAYDAIRELLQTNDPQGRITKYSWCTCGGLSTLTDGNGNVTNWALDTQGRVTSKTYGYTGSTNASTITYAYENNLSRLHSMTDAKGNVSTYTYNSDNTLNAVAYAVTTATSPANVVTSATPGVSFGYDPVYNRVTQMTDGTGTTHYYYNTNNGALGFGRLSSVTVPIAGTSSTATVAYQTTGSATGYDELGRVVSRTIDGANPVGTTFDALGRVTGVSNALGAFSYGYVDETSRLKTVTYPVGTGGTGQSLNTIYNYYSNTAASGTGNGDQRLQEIKNLKGSTQLSKFDYTYNLVGTIATWTQQADSSTAVVNTS
jgi:YD repeat-containing protein